MDPRQKMELAYQNYQQRRKTGRRINLISFLIAPAALALLAILNALGVMDHTAGKILSPVVGILMILGVVAAASAWGSLHSQPAAFADRTSMLFIAEQLSELYGGYTMEESPNYPLLESHFPEKSCFMTCLKWENGGNPFRIHYGSATIDYGDSDSPGRSEPLFIISTRQLAHLYGTKEEALAHLKATFTADYYDKDYFEDKLWFSMGYSLYRMLPKDVRTDCVEQWLNDCEPYLRKIRSELEKALVSPEKREN